MAAPMPISLSAEVLPVVTATMVTTLSGSAVPKAARTVPVAVWLTFSLRPTHSTPFTKNSQARYMTAAERVTSVDAKGPARHAGIDPARLPAPCPPTPAAKCVDASPSRSGGRLLPNDDPRKIAGYFVVGNAHPLPRPFTPNSDCGAARLPR